MVTMMSRAGGKLQKMLGGRRRAALGLVTGAVFLGMFPTYPAAPVCTIARNIRKPLLGD